MDVAMGLVSPVSARGSERGGKGPQPDADGFDRALAGKPVKSMPQGKRDEETPQAPSPWTLGGYGDRLSLSMTREPSDGTADGDLGELLLVPLVKAPDAETADAAAPAQDGAGPEPHAPGGDGAPDQGENGTGEDRAELLAQLRARNAELVALQGDSPLILPIVDAQAVASVIGDWTGIPVGRMVRDETETVLDLETHLARRVIGQDHAMRMIAKRIQTSRAGLDNPSKPIGVFLLVGTSGVGKTETAIALAETLYGGERSMITINMSEYQEAHTVSSLKGSPPGYVGYGEGGVLTEAVRRRPYSVVLLDEIEKAHPDVLELFFQVFDKGVLDDAEGREVDFRNTLIILTSNVGSAQIMQACLNKPAAELPAADALAEALRPVLCKHFKPAFLGRVKVVPYYPISDDILTAIIDLKLQRIRERIAANHKAAFQWSDALVEAVLARCTEVDSGARNVDHILNGTLLPAVADAVLGRMAEGQAIARIKAGADKRGQFKYTIA